MGKMPNVYLWLLHEYAPTCEHVCTDTEHGERGEAGRERPRARDRGKEMTHRERQGNRETDIPLEKKKKTLVLFGLFTLKTGDTLVSNSLRAHSDNPETSYSQNCEP